MEYHPLPSPSPDLIPLTGMCHLSLYQVLSEALHISRCMRHYSFFSFILITNSLSPLPKTQYLRAILHPYDFCLCLVTVKENK